MPHEIKYEESKSIEMDKKTILAERYDCFDILTTDQRDFRAGIAGSRGRHSRILPYDG